MGTLRAAHLDLAALERNLIRVGVHDPVDLSGDAYGHGLLRVGAVAVELGARHFVVHDDAEDAALRAGFPNERLVVDVAQPVSTAPQLYGVGADDRFSPVMRVSARVISIKRLAAGDPVSYGYTWRAPVDTSVALVGIGYADGIARRASNRATAYLSGPRPIVGRIAMDVLSLDMGDDPVSIGDEATVFGNTPGSTEAWAQSIGVPPLSVTAAIGSRVPRVLAEGAS